MKPVSSLEFLCLSRFSKPNEDRVVYRTMRKNKYRAILEVGLGSGDRAEKMIRVAKKYGLSSSIRYTGIDLFEGREKSDDQLSLRQMHQRLSKSEAKVQLVPGDLYSALCRVANAHVRTDLILITGQDEEALQPCWFYFPRMLHAGSTLMLQESVGQPFKIMNRLEIEKLAEQNTPQKSARAA